LDFEKHLKNRDTYYILTIRDLLIFVAVSLWINNGPNPVPLLLIITLQLTKMFVDQSSGLVITTTLCLPYTDNKKAKRRKSE
jgi:hypothetical protein